MLPADTHFHCLSASAALLHGKLVQSTRAWEMLKCILGVGHTCMRAQCAYSQGTQLPRRPCTHLGPSSPGRPTKRALRANLGSPQAIPLLHILLKTASPRACSLESSPVAICRAVRLPPCRGRATWRSTSGFTMRWSARAARCWPSSWSCRSAATSWWGRWRLRRGSWRSRRGACMLSSRRTRLQTQPGV